MSELTFCNYCNLKGIESRLKKGEKITKLPYSGTEVSIFVHNKDIEANLDPEGPHFKAWFMELTDYCVC